MRPTPSQHVKDGNVCPRCRTTDVEVLRTDDRFEYRFDRDGRIIGATPEPPAALCQQRHFRRDYGDR
ncbi:MAG: hypothetical protein FJ280_15275 [Planctomycetes bacterium]|nr:hypothetical protein [Planctomycetota bacterium]